MLVKNGDLLGLFFTLFYSLRLLLFLIDDFIRKEYELWPRSDQYLLFGTEIRILELLVFPNPIQSFSLMMLDL